MYDKRKTLSEKPVSKPCFKNSSAIKCFQPQNPTTYCNNLTALEHELISCKKVVQSLNLRKEPWQNWMTFLKNGRSLNS